MAGSIWALLTLLVGGYTLLTYLSDVTLRQFDEALSSQQLQIVVALNNSGGDPDTINSYISNPDYNRPYSGSYWQASGPNDVFLTSRSLFDTFLPDPPIGLNERLFWQDQGPVEQVRGIHQNIVLADGTEWVVTVAQTLEGLNAERQRTRQNLVSTLILIGAFGVLATVLWTSVMIRPLTKLGEDVSRRWDEGVALRSKDYPEEVAPLVTDINTLLARNREIVDRARRQAADMAHALKTPSAILRNELEILEMEGAQVSQAQEALERIDAQLMRSLARIRAANSGAGLAERIDLKVSVDRLARLFRSMHEAEGRFLETELPDSLKITMDVQDLEEVLGNMLENAFKYCETLVRVRATTERGLVIFTIEDDGPGIPEDKRQEAMRSGGRLDTSKPGTGLGLAIAADLLQAYGGSLDLRKSDELGGLEVRCAVPNRTIAQAMTRQAE